jgi:hypothetical protein
MNTINKILAACLIGSVAFSLNAQVDPGAYVDENGNLVLSDNTVIAPPAGEVVDGNLVVGGNTIMAPVVTVNNDGSITLEDNTVLTVPVLPNGGEFIVSWFGSDLFDFDTSKPADQNQWYFSYTFKNMYHFAADNWFYSLEMDATLYFRPDSGNKSLEDGIWVYTNNLFNGQASGSWIWLSGQNGFTTLVDTDSDGEVGDEAVSGFIYVKNASGYPTTEEGFFFFGEYPDGNFIWRVGDLPNAQKLREATL